MVKVRRKSYGNKYFDMKGVPYLAIILLISWLAGNN
jgi:hypothetical protein